VGRLLAVAINIRLKWIGQPGTNTRADWAHF
jgi:hypothetical protein